MLDRTAALGIATLTLLLGGCVSSGTESTSAPATATRPAQIAASPAPAPLLLLFTKTRGFRHESITPGVTAVERIAKHRRIGLVATEDPAVFADSTLTAISAVVFLNTSGDVLNEEQQASLERYIRGGGGFAGIHAAADTEHDWYFYGQLLGARLASHPPGLLKATVRVEDRAHPSMRELPAMWERTDEWYNFHSNPRLGVRVLANLDENSYSGGSMTDHPIAWCHSIDTGRSWYTAGGHTSESYSDPMFFSHMQGGILWAAGLEAGKC